MNDKRRTTTEFKKITRRIGHDSSLGDHSVSWRQAANYSTAIPPKDICQSYVSCELCIRALKLYTINTINEVAMYSEKHLYITTFSYGGYIILLICLDKT